jgi:hypothetical protein
MNNNDASSDEEEHDERRRELARLFPAGRGLQRSEALVRTLVEHVTLWALAQPVAEAWVGSTASIYDPLLREECGRTNMAARILSVLEQIHLSLAANTGTDARPLGAPLDQVLWRCAARPPYPADVPHGGCGRISLHDLAVALMDGVVCASKGLLNLKGLSTARRQHMVLLLAERKADATVSAIPLRAGLAVFLVYDPTTAATSHVPPVGSLGDADNMPGVVPWSGLSEEHRRAPAFWYAGFTLVDKALVSAAAGAVDIT